MTLYHVTTEGDCEGRTTKIWGMLKQIRLNMLSNTCIP